VGIYGAVTIGFLWQGHKMTGWIRPWRHVGEGKNPCCGRWPSSVTDVTYKGGDSKNRPGNVLWSWQLKGRTFSKKRILEVYQRHRLSYVFISNQIDFLIWFQADVSQYLDQDAEVEVTLKSFQEAIAYGPFLFVQSGYSLNSKIASTNIWNLP